MQFCWQSIYYTLYTIYYIYYIIYSIYLDDALPLCSMCGICTCIYHKFKTNLGRYSIHGAYGLLNSPEFFRWRCFSILNGSSKGSLLVGGLLSVHRFKSLASHLYPEICKIWLHLPGLHGANFTHPQNLAKIYLSVTSTTINGTTSTIEYKVCQVLIQIHLSSDHV